MTSLPNRRLPPHLRLWLPMILGLGFGIRVMLATSHPFFFPDSADYDTLANAIVHHQPYQSGGYFATRMPGYPLFLAAIYVFTGSSLKAAMFVQALLGTGIILFTYLLAARVSRGVALCAAALIALDPLSVGFTAALLSETPFTFFLLLSLWLCLTMIERPFGMPPSGRKVATREIYVSWLGLGLVWAICVYLRASMLWLTILMAVVVLVVQRPRVRPLVGRNIGGAALALLLLWVALTPWLSRNYAIFHSGFFRLTTLEGISLYEAVYPEADGGPRQDKIILPPEMRLMNEAQRNDEWSRRAWHYVRTNPLRIARLATIKFARTWSPTFNAAEMRSPLVQKLMAAWYIPLFIFGLVGLLKTPRLLLPVLLLPILYFSLLHSLFLGSIRYRVPLMPLVCIFAAIGLFNLVNLFRRDKPSLGASV